MRALSLHQAANCENARGAVCRCRCGGAAHGCKRAGSQGEPDRSFFEALPEDDPHKLPTKAERKARRRWKTEEERQQQERAADRERLRQWNELATGRRWP